MPSSAMDVLIVGSGPTSLTLATILAARGIEASVVDRQAVRDANRLQHFEGASMHDRADAIRAGSGRQAMRTHHSMTRRPRVCP